MTRAPALLVLCAALFCTSAAASTPESWAALDRAAQASCKREILRQASRAKVQSVRGRVSGIGLEKDSDRYYALLLRGTTAGFAGEWLCLYDKIAKKAAAREIEKL